MKNILEIVKQDIQTDYTWNRVARLGPQGFRALPTGTANYLTEKVPIVGWLPRYRPRWLISDAIAGLTVGLMLIPQALSYAKIATIPVEYGLATSFLPGMLYAIMGTSKDTSAGPTSLIGLLTAEVVSALKSSENTPQEIASAVAMSMGIYGLVIGLLKLGWILDFISLPVLSGFISAVAITIGLGQVSSLLGETGVGNGTAQIIHDVFHQLPTANGYACGVGFGAIILLVGLEKIGKRWAKQNKFVWFLMITRAFIALVLFTGISYGVNHGRKDLLFDIVKVQSHGIQPRVPRAGLLAQALPRSIAVFFGAAIEHTAIARGFGVKNGYETDQTQEVTYFGLVNFINSFFGAMGAGGAMSRAAVNSQCNVKSPLGGVLSGVVVLVCIYCLSPVLYWVPKAALAAIIICAVFPLISPPSIFYRYWKTSLADFISSQIAFWVCLFVSTEYGIAASVGFNILYLLVKQVFTRVSHEGGSLATISFSSTFPPASPSPTTISTDTRIFHFNDACLFSNAHRTTSSMISTIQTYHSPHHNASLSQPAPETTWSVQAEIRLAKQRKKAQVTDPDALPPIRIVILDFAKCTHIDVTGVTNLRTFLDEVWKYGGEHCSIRFVGMSRAVKERFERAGWKLYFGERESIPAAVNVEEAEKEMGKGKVVIPCFEDVGRALTWVEDDVRSAESLGGEVEKKVGVDWVEEVV